MSITKKLFHHSSNSYLLIITAVVMLLGIISCDCDKSISVESATELDVTLTPELLHGAQRTAVLTVSTKGGNNEVAKFTDFDLQLKIEAKGKGGVIGNSLVKYTGYDPATGKPHNEEITLKTGKPMEVSKRTSLYHFFPGGQGGSFEFKQRNELKFEIVPDMSREVESITITVTVFGNVADAAGSMFQKTLTTTWQRSPYDFKIIDLDPKKVIKGDKCTIQMSRKDGKPIQTDELEDLSIKFKRDPDDGKFPEITEVNHKGEIDFVPSDLQSGKIEKVLTIIPGPGKQEVILTFELHSSNSENAGNEAEAIAMAIYHPDVMPYIVMFDKDKLVGLQQQDKSLEVTVQSDGKVLDVDELKKLKLKIERTAGDATIKGAVGTGPSFEVPFDGSELNIGQAIKKVIIETYQQPKAAFTIQLFKTDTDGSEIEVSQKLNITWAIGLEVAVVYHHANKKFEYVLKNATTDPIDNVVLGWEGLNGTPVKVGGGSTGSKNIANIPANNQEKGGLDVDWGGVIGIGVKQEAEFKFTVTVGGVQVYQEAQKIEKDAPKVTIKLKNAGKKYKGEGEKEITFTIMADGADLDKDELKKLKIRFESDQGELQTADGENVKNLNLAEVLTKAGIDKLENNKSKDIRFKIDNKGQYKVTFQNIYLDGSHNAKANEINEKITWEGDVQLTMMPGDSNAKVIDGYLVVDPESKKFVIKITNTSGFSLDESILKNITMDIAVADNPKKPDNISYSNKQITPGTSVTLWDILQVFGKKLLKEPLSIPFIINSGTKSLVEFEIRLKGQGPFGGIDISQQVKWGSPYGGQIEIIDSDKVIEVKKDVDNKLKFSFKLKNVSGKVLAKNDLEQLALSIERNKANKKATIRSKNPKVSKFAVTKIGLEGNVGKMVQDYEGKIDLGIDGTTTLADVLRDSYNKDSLEVDEVVDVEFVMEASYTKEDIQQRQRDFFVCVEDKTGRSKIAQVQIQEKWEEKKKK